MMGSTLVGEDKDKLQQLTEATSSTKSSYASWLRYFNEGDGTRSGLIVETFLANWLSWFIFPSGPEDGMND